MRKTAYHHGDLRRALLDQARQRIEAEGVAALSLKAISNAVGVSHAAAYKHFSNRAALLQAVSDEGMQRFAAALRRSVADRTGSESYYALGRAVLQFASAHPRLYAFIFGESRRDSRQSLQDAPDDAAIHVVLEQVRGWQAAGWLAPGAPMEQALLLWAGIHGVAMLISTGRLSLSPADAAGFSDSMMTVLHSGLRPH